SPSATTVRTGGGPTTTARSPFDPCSHTSGNDGPPGGPRPPESSVEARHSRWGFHGREAQVGHYADEPWGGRSQPRWLASSTTCRWNVGWPGTPSKPTGVTWPGTPPT